MLRSFWSGTFIVKDNIDNDNNYIFINNDNGIDITDNNYNSNNNGINISFKSQYCYYW